MELDEAKTLLAAFEQEGVEYVLIGSIAMAVQGLVRATHDIDFFVSPEPANVERLRNALRLVFDDPDIDQITAEDLNGEYPAIEYNPPGAGYTMDILARLGEAFRYADLEWHQVEWRGVQVRVATPQTLYAMKRDTVRPHDQIDAGWIRNEFKLEDK